MTLHARFEVTDRDVSVAIEVPSGRTTAIIGPNGSGKSTVLDVIAGLLRADTGEARLGDRVLFDDRIYVPAHRRRLALLAQQPRLFPRMTVGENVEFALRARGAPRAQATHWLDLVSCTDLAQRRPRELSGGQAQRVAIARALAAEPELLLLDEPLAALDPGVAADLRHTLKALLIDSSALLVTHEPLDAAVLADEVVVMRAGRIVESGPVTTVMRNPRTDFAADMFGLNLMFGVASGPGVLSVGAVSLTGLGQVTPGEPAVASFPPAAVGVYRQPPHGSPRNVVEATVTTLTPHGQIVRVGTDVAAADLTPGAVAELQLAPGARVFLVVKAAEVRLYPR